MAAALHTARVPALRARACRGGAPTATDYADTPSVVETEPAQRKGPGEAAVTRGTATVYLSAALLEAYPDLVLELHTVPDRPDRPGPAPPTLRLRPPTTPDHLGAGPASHRERASPDPRRGPRREDAATDHTPVRVNDTVTNK